MKKIFINTEFIKLNTFMKLAGLSTTGGQAKQTILSGKISVNDEICLQRGKKLRNKDIVKFQETEYEVVSVESNENQP